MKHSVLQLNFSKTSFAFILSFLLLTEAKAQLTINSAVTPTQLVSSLLGGGLSVSNISLNCPSGASGTFSNGNTTNIGISNGIILTTGQATNAIGPNNSASAGTCNGTSGSDPQLVAIEPLATHDMCVLEFDMVPNCNTLQIRFVFGSDEYPEFVNGGFNDAFGFFITGPGPACQPGFYANSNVATLPNNITPVAIDNVNNGTNNTGPCVNCAFYVNNTSGTTIQYDGFTTVLTRTVALCPCQTYHFKLAIADAGDCNYDSGVLVDFMQCSTALTATSSFTPISGCSTCDGTATVTAAGGNAPYTYSWSPTGGNGATATGLCPGTYTCIITDAGACTPAQTVTVTIPPNGGVTATLSTQGNVSCNGGNNGSATVSASGGTPGYTYSWAPSGGTNATATGLPSGTYTVTITDAVGCSTTQQVTITQPSALTASASGTNVACNGGTNGSAIAVPSGGTPGYTYAWAPSGGTNATASGLAAGTYTVTVTDANGCSTTQQTTLTAPPALTSSASSTSVSCNGGTNGTGTVVAGGGSPLYSYSWAPSGGTNATATGLNAGTYTVTITDANGCSRTQPVTITQPTALSVSAANTAVSCSGNDGTATATPTGGTAGYTYSWAPSGGNAATATGLAPGSYTVTVTDANGCVSTQSTTLTQSNSLTSTTTQTNIACFGNANGSATATPIGGTAPFTYAWSPSGGTNATANNLAAGSYTVTVTDNTGCVGTASLTITQPAVLSATSTSVNNLCFGGSNGSATVIPAGGTPAYTYLWAPSGGTNATATGLAAGTYTVNVTDANGCTTTQSFAITQPPTAPAATSSSTNITCFGGSNGSGTVTASGGTPGYTYNWMPSGGTNANASGLNSGSYTCTITDANGCNTTQSITVTQPSAITTSATVANVSCNGGNNGSATVTPLGGIPGYTYNWAPAGGTNATASGLSTGTYTVTVTDANGCTAIQTVSITQPTVLTTAMTGNNICPGDNGTVAAAASGGTGPYTYLWSNGATTASQTFTSPVAGTYTVTITDANGCTTTGTTAISLISAPNAAFTTNAINGTFQLSAGTGMLCFTDASTGAVSWTWSLDGNPSIVQSPCVQVTNANSGSFCATLFVVNDSGCVDSTRQCLEIGESYYSIPNVFTPGSDGVNDGFVITNVGMKSLHCEIYNRWGELIYEWEGTTGYWNGKTKNGNDVVDGVYYYTAHLVDFADKVFEESGFVQLIKGN
ncbi:MAG: choice-of-anchor L domain-containing protein [Bacteroidia bacterium]